MLDTSLLSINPALVCELIVKAKEFHAKEGVTFEEVSAQSEYEYDWAQVLASHADDLSYQEAQRAIEDLEPDQKTDLLALFYVGRGDYAIKEWHLARREAKQNLAPNLSAYLFSKPMLASYLAKALEDLGYICEI